MPTLKRTSRQEEKRRTMTASVEKQDAQFAPETLRRMVEAIRAGRDLPDLAKIHVNFYTGAKILLKMSEKGAQAWASLQVEELRRQANAQIEAESNRSPNT